MTMGSIFSFALLAAMIIVTIILEIPNIITGFMGMNVSFPEFLSKNTVIPMVVLAFLIAISFVAIYIFDKKDWF